MAVLKSLADSYSSLSERTDRMEQSLTEIREQLTEALRELSRNRP